MKKNGQWARNVADRGSKAALAFMLLLAGGAANAQGVTNSSGIALAVGSIDAEQQCTVYQQMAGRRSQYLDAYSYASHESFITWLVKDCVSNFPAAREALEAALASSGKFAQRPGGYVVSGHILEVSGGGGPAPGVPADPGPNGFAYSSTGMFVTMTFSVRDARGRIVYGDVLTKRIEVSNAASVGGFQAYSTNGGQGMYGVLQRALAQAVARKIAFQFVPLQVTRNTGQTIQLNYGSPLLALGQLIQATSPDGGEVIRYRVTSASGGTALAELDGDGDTSRITPGSTAAVIEADDPAANGRRFRRVPLP